MPAVVVAAICHPPIELGTTQLPFLRSAHQTEGNLNTQTLHIVPGNQRSTGGAQRSTGPETVYQATEWDHMKTRYMQRGLCHRCAGQAAWGHQNGFGTIKPPCSLCLPVIASFSRHEEGQWCSEPRRSNRGKRKPVSSPPF